MEIKEDDLLDTGNEIYEEIFPEGFSQENVVDSMNNPGVGRVLLKDDIYFYNPYENDNFSRDIFELDRVSDEDEYTQEMKDGLIWTFNGRAVGKRPDGSFFMITTVRGGNGRTNSDFWQQRRVIGKNNWE
jgi:hypothetical protein